MGDSRREFLRTTTGVLSGLSLAGSGWAGAATLAGVRTRKDVSTLTATSPDIVALKTAVGKMKAELGPGDRRNWLAQAQIHGTFTGGFTFCQHGNWYFLPWHRGYLYFFEEIIRQLSGYEDFALPYWDWSKDFSLPALFWGAGNPLDNPPRPGEPNSGRGVTPSSTISLSDQAQFVSKSVVSGVLGQPDFETFAGLQGALSTMPGAGELEGTPHNFIHRWVNNDMATAESSVDPIFWLHHSNVDRLWTEWVKMHPTGMPSGDPTWTGTSLPGFCDRNGNPVNNFTVDKTFKTTDLGYDYAPPAPVNSNFGPAPPGKSAPGFRSVGLVQHGGRRDPNSPSGVSIYQYVPTPNLLDQVDRVIENGVDERKRTVRMRLQNIKIPSNQNVALRVHVNCPLENRDVPITDPSYVRSCTFFYPHAANAQGHGGEGGHDTISFVMSVKPTHVRLYGDRKLTKDEPLKVMVIAQPLFPDSSKSWRGEVQEVSPELVSFEVVEGK
jgi:tyrosinase